ncbi:glycine-rich cell wall structural protein 1.8-like [Cryptomeria japonica]|uniref:glycine-rich cell wall structural protein 1.8-like n=1 Tax=Cryptomeria japonica TaxID=3369 RepID=UPI0027DA55E5|nr:glycine-rich cell wall structural protein 1.8-like [Cryptomeria japonica]
MTWPVASCHVASVDSSGVLLTGSVVRVVEEVAGPPVRWRQCRAAGGLVGGTGSRLGAGGGGGADGGSSKVASGDGAADWRCGSAGRHGREAQREAARWRGGCSGGSRGAWEEGAATGGAVGCGCSRGAAGGQ